MLSLVGLGLYDEKDLTLRGIEEAKKADEVFLELYTGAWKGDRKKLEKIIRKKVKLLSRSDLEENSRKIIDLAKTKKVVIFIPGDPLVATTHASLVYEAKEHKIKTNIIHNSSIISAIAETGLHVYKFGPVVTIPLRDKIKGELPKSVYTSIKENKSRGLHTLCLLDVDFEGEKHLSPTEAIRILLEIEEKFDKGVISLNSDAIIASKIGSKSPKIAYLSLKKALNSDLREIPAVLILPGKLHFSEKVYLNLFRKP